MDPLLFLGREFLYKMSGSEITAEERETYREALAVYSESEEGRETPRRLVSSFNDLREEEYRAFAPETLLWFLDWIASQQDKELIVGLQSRVFRNIWAAFEEVPVRARVLEVAFQSQAGRVRPEESVFRNISEIAGPDRDLLVDFLQLEGSEYAQDVLRVIGEGTS